MPSREEEALAGRLPERQLVPTLDVVDNVDIAAEAGRERLGVGGIPHAGLVNALNGRFGVLLRGVVRQANVAEEGRAAIVDVAMVSR